MKKIFTLIGVLALAITTAFAADDNYTYAWNHTIDGLPAAGDNVLGMAKSADGKVFLLSQFCSGSSSASVASGYRNAPDISGFLNLYIDGQKALDDNGSEIIGNDYKTTDGTSTAENALLQKVDPKTGEILWNVWTDRGEPNSNYSHVIPTKDGGAVLIMYYRHWAQGKGDTLMRIHGTNGTVKTMKTKKVGVWTDQNGAMHLYYVPIMVKINSDGEIVSNRALWTVEPVTNLQLNPSWLSYTRGVTIDDEGNYYVCGNFRTTLTFTMTDNTKTKITAKNVSGWTGDDQNSIGDLYLAKFRASDGKCLAVYTAEGTATQTYLQKLAYKDGKIYAVGTVQGDGTSITIGNKSLTFPTTGQSLLVAAFDTNLKPLYAKGYGATSTGALHIENLQVFNGNLYMSGSFLSRNGNGALKDLDDENTTIFQASTKQHKGYIIELNPEDGSHIATGKISQTSGLTKLYGIFRTKEAGKYYLNGWGYDMMTGGANIYKFDATPDADNALENIDYTNVVNRGQGFAMVQTTPVVVGNNVVLMSRLGKANTGQLSFNLLGGVETAKVNCWAVVATSYTNPNLVDEDVTTGISNISVKSNKITSNRVYTISGQYVGESLNNLPAGLYIQNGRKVVVK